MNSSCPSCGPSVGAPSQPAGRRGDSCPRCATALGPSAGESGQVLGRMALARMTAAEAEAARQAAVAHRAQPPRMPGPPPTPASPVAIDLPDGDCGSFVIEAAGGERAIDFAGVLAPAAGRTAPRDPAPCVVVAEDNPLMRQMVTATLVEAEPGLGVTTCGTGEEFLEAMSSRLAARIPVRVAVLNVELPVLNGYQAAIALRAVERGLGVAGATPLIFFTTHPCDEVLRKVLEYCQPARYLNKALAASPAQAARRLAEVLAAMSR